VVGVRSYIIGLDLHGTLLEPGEIIRPEHIDPVASGLARIKDRATRFICTGNDLGFVLKKVHPKILQQIDGHVLETGCSASLDGQAEQVLTTEEEMRIITDLEQKLREEGFPEINYFAHRLTTVSMFCNHPREFRSKVAAFVESRGFGRQVEVTYSSVAVDVLPRGYNKFTGLARVAEGGMTIGVADSMNDSALLVQADYALAPANLAPELEALLKKNGRTVEPIKGREALERGVAMKAAQKETRGVIEILQFLDRALPPERGSS